MKYDIVIIGAGSAGAILATRLSENPERSVLLLEAGPDYPDVDSLPDVVKYSNAGAAEITSTHNWQFKARATDANEIEVPRGRVTGGSSAINATIFLRGVPQDYDTWAKQGNDQWSFQELVPYFNRIETDTTYQDDPGDFHGSGGPIICHRFPRDEWLAGSSAFVDACLDAGFPAFEDANAPGTSGVGPTPLNNPNGIRWSTAIGYLGQAHQRLNLTIRPHVAVKRVVFDTSGERPRATGVEVISGDEAFVVEAEEVILSAGAIGSPQLLLLSGVGPEAHLKERGVRPLLQSPGVGQNLRDHPILSVVWETKPEVPLDGAGPSHQTMLRYTADGSPLENDMIVWMFAVARERHHRSQLLGRRPPIGISSILGLNLALGSGQLQLESSDYRDQPVLDYNYLAEAEDRRRLRDGIRMLVGLETHPSMSALIDRRVGPLDSDLDSDDALDAWMRSEVATGHHVSGTCKMGPESDPMAVVDQHGRVHGTDGLRVADASIMPDCVRANTNVTTMVIGERISDFVIAGA